MAILDILQYPDPRLATIAQPVKQFDQDLWQFIDNMWDTMYHDDGIGLAATQVNQHIQLLVIDISHTAEKLEKLPETSALEHAQNLEKLLKKWVIINPVIQSLSREQNVYKEGCLSVKGFYENVTRPENIVLSYQDKQGQQKTLHANGLLATCIQHEIDHLNGKVFVDHLSRLKKDRIVQKIKKERKA